MTRASAEVQEAIQLWQVRPFARGSADCCAFANHVLHELTGRSPIPRYRTDEGAEAIIATHGGLSEAVSYFLQSEPAPEPELEPGDVVFLVVMGHEAIGILATAERVVTVFEDGNPRAVSRGFVEHGWRTWV